MFFKMKSLIFIISLFALCINAEIFFEEQFQGKFSIFVKVKIIARCNLDLSLNHCVSTDP